MQDLSKIDFSKCKLPELSGRRLVARLDCGRVSIMDRDNEDPYVAFLAPDGWAFGRGVSGLLLSDGDSLRGVCRQVDTFIESEFAKQSEPEWRPCTAEFAFTHPTESEWQCEAAMEEWSPIDRHEDYCPQCEFRTKVPPQQPDHLDTRNQGRTYSVKAPETEPTIADLAEQVKRLRRRVRKLEKREEGSK